MPGLELSTPGSGEEAIPDAGVVIGGRYVVEGLLGKGGMSIVLLARDLRLGHRVALKVLQGSKDRRSDQTRRFLREARIIAQLRSDHVVSVLDVDTTSEPPYLAMELLEGQTVANLLAAHGRLSVELALRIIAQVSRGVADAHALGVMHRDLKPSNLIVARAADGGQRVKVIDFGISKPILRNSADPELTSTGEILGSPRYMSPEQVRAGGRIDARSDIWAIGAILYELIAGVSPFDAPTVADTLARIVRDTPTPLREHVPDVPERVASVVALCLSKDPALRPPDVRTLLDEIESMTPPGPLSIDELPSRDHPLPKNLTTQRTADTKLLSIDETRTQTRSWSLSRSRHPIQLQAPRLGVAAAIMASAGIAAWLGLRAVARPSVAPPPQSAAPTAMSLRAPQPADIPAPAAIETVAPPRVNVSPPSSRPRPTAPRRAQRRDAGEADDDLELNRRN
jgi:serine/threonine-protein kinase